MLLELHEKGFKPCSCCLRKVTSNRFIYQESPLIYLFRLPYARPHAEDANFDFSYRVQMMVILSVSSYVVVLSICVIVSTCVVAAQVYDVV